MYAAEPPLTDTSRLSASRRAIPTPHALKRAARAVVPPGRGSARENRTVDSHSVRLEDATAAGAFEPDLSLWDAWRPERAAALFAGVQAPWYVAAGWALDLFLGEERREHEDLEIAVPRERFS